MAERKARSLLECGARVVVVSPYLCAGLRRLVDEDRIEAVWREYREGDLENAFIVVAATDSEEINAAVAEEGEQRGALVNVVDHPEKGNLLVPAVARCGDLAVSISTAGRSPALAKSLRLHLERALIPDYARLLEVMSRVRDKARRKGMRVDGQAWQDLLSSDIIEMVKHGKVTQAEERMLYALESSNSGLRRERRGKRKPLDVEPGATGTGVAKPGDLGPGGFESGDIEPRDSEGGR